VEAEETGFFHRNEVLRSDSKMGNIENYLWKNWHEIYVEKMERTVHEKRWQEEKFNILFQIGFDMSSVA
jgi:hypothetical protein